MHILGQNFGFLQTALLKAVYFQMHCSVTTNAHDAWKQTSTKHPYVMMHVLLSQKEIVLSYDFK